MGFRYTALRAAQGWGLTGWVRNESDGSVSLHAEGAAQNLEAFAQWLRQGPPGAMVSGVSIIPCAATGYYADFSVEY